MDQVKNRQIETAKGATHSDSADVSKACVWHTCSRLNRRKHNNRQGKQSIFCANDNK